MLGDHFFEKNEENNKLLEENNKLLEENNKLFEENNILKKKIDDLEQKLKKYTNGDNHTRYYEKNKDKIKINGLSYLKNLKLENPEKIKEYNNNAYIKRKEKKNIVKEKIEQVSMSVIELSTVIEPIAIIYSE